MIQRIQPNLRQYQSNLLNPNQIFILDENKKCNNCHTQYCGKWKPTISKYPKYFDAKHTTKTKKKRAHQNKRKESNRYNPLFKMNDE